MENIQNEENVTLSAYDHKKIDKDIKYKAPLSYRYLRFIGWISMSIMFISMMLTLSMKIKSGTGAITPEGAEAMEAASSILSYFSYLPLPLFLIANFAVILQNKNNYKKLIINYARILLLIYLGFIVVYYHYIVILLMRAESLSFIEARQLSIDIFTMIGKQNGLVVNVFVDLFCCVLIMFFIDYVPKKHFKGKKIILFRLLVLLPILYEIGSAVLMGLLGFNSLSYTFTFSLPPEVLPLIGKKPIGMIFAFVIICLYVKIREKHYLKKGGTKEGYKLFLKTNRNTFRFSSVMSLIFLVVAIVDFFAMLIPVLVTFNPTDPDSTELLISVLSGFTIGKSACLLFTIPFVMLFSYSKQHKNIKFDRLVPIIGIGLVVFSIIETLFFALLF